jgi:hypothetical protein
MRERIDGSTRAKTRQRIEQDLLEVLNLRQREWISATDDNRDLARRRFMDALHAFNDFVLDGKLPENQ